MAKPTATSLTYTYNGSEQAYTFASAGDAAYYDVENLTRTAAGDYVNGDAVKVSLKEIANTFLTGHAVRVEIHSADFPKDARNLNTAAPVNEGVVLRKAVQKILHDGLHPSRLILPEATGEI